MRKLTLFLIGIFTLVTLQIESVQSQTTDFTYQASLKNGTAPANGNHDFEFILFDALSVGTQIGPVVAVNGVPVTDGNFSVKLDFGNVFPGAARYLEIRVRPTGQPGMTILTPRQLLTSAPYSVKSLTAENATAAATANNALSLGGVAANQYVVTTDPRMTDARSPTPGSANYIQNGTSPQTSNFNIAGTGTAAIFNATRYDIDGVRILSGGSRNNTFVGVGTGESNTTGNQNSFFGDNAGNSNTAGINNSFMGRSAGAGNSSGHGNAFFGAFAGLANSTGGGNTFVGFRVGSLNTTGFANAFFGDVAGATNVTGDHNTIIGGGADVGSSGLSYATAIGAAATASTSNSITLGRSGGQDLVRIPGNLVLLELSTGGVTSICRNAFSLIATCSSSARYKSNIVTFSSGLDLTRRLRPVSFNWTEGGMPDLGLVAEEVNKIEPLLTTTNAKGEIEGVKYDRVSVVLINAIKEQQAEIESLRRDKADLRNELRTTTRSQQDELKALKAIACSIRPNAAICRRSHREGK